MGNKIRIPKWVTAVGATTVIAAFTPAVKTLIATVLPPAYQQLADEVLAGAGVLAAAYGTPLHANTDHGGVVLPGETAAGAVRI